MRLAAGTDADRVLMSPLCGNAGGEAAVKKGRAGGERRQVRKKKPANWPALLIPETEMSGSLLGGRRFVDRRHGEVRQLVVRRLLLVEDLA